MLNPIKELIEWKKHGAALATGAGAGLLQLADPVIAMFGTDARFWMAFAGMIPSTITPSIPAIGDSLGMAMSAGLIAVTMVAKVLQKKRGGGS